MRNGKLAVLVLALAAWILLPISVMAQQDNEQQITEIAGPYKIGVTTIPSTLSLGRVQFVVTVVDSASRQPIPNARVLIHTRKESEVTGGWAIALSNSEIPDRYQAIVEMDDPGIWTVQLEVSSSLGNILIDIPSVEILAARQLTAGSFVFIGVFLVLIMGSVYVWWTVGHQKRMLRPILSQQASADE
jgi:hypothetical protein